jgi:tripartite-type tricarboxylate transporter receptor subunit TctC
MGSILVRAGFALLIALATATAGAQDGYPAKPIRLIVPYPPGGLTDASARAVAGSLSPRLRQTIVIENIGGGGGNIGAERAAKSAPDGYTLYVGNNATVGINTLIYRSLAFDPITDLVPVSLYAESQTVLVVNPSVAAKTVRELVALAKAKPGTINFGSTGTGGLSHLASELFKSRAGIQVTHVPYKGTGPALTDLLGGQIQMMFNDTVIPHIRSGKLRALAVTGEKRWPQLPDVPTMGELGYAGYETYNWFGILAPKGTPPAIVARVNREIVATMREPELRKWMADRGAEAASNSPAEFAAYIRKDLAKWARVVRDVGISAD